MPDRHVTQENKQSNIFVKIMHTYVTCMYMYMYMYNIYVHTLYFHLMHTVIRCVNGK